MKQSKKPLEASLRICCYFWPNLKTTSNFSGDVDFALIPRAMQVEEDIGRCLNEYKNVASVLRAFNANNASAHTSAQHDDTPLSVPSFDAALARGKGKKSKAERATATASSSSGGVTL